jgi:hypothetical protein
MIQLITRLNSLPSSVEGHWDLSSKPIVDFLATLNIKTMLEIGFNTGYSATMFLEMLNLSKFYSIDIGIHSHVKPLYENFKKEYGSKFDYLIEDSLNIRDTHFNDINYDLVFIDGSHSFEIALNDWLFCVEPVKTQYILLDDTGGRSPGVTKLITYLKEHNYKLDLVKEWDFGAGCMLFKIS